MQKTLYDCYVLTSRISKKIKIKLNACVAFSLVGIFFEFLITRSIIENLIDIPYICMVWKESHSNPVYSRKI